MDTKIKNNFNKNDKLNNLLSKAKERNEKNKNKNPYNKSSSNKTTELNSIGNSNLSLEQRINLLKSKVKGKTTTTKDPNEITLIKIDDKVSVTKAIALLKQKQQDK